MRKNIHEFITKNQVFISFIYGLIVVNVIVLILESYSEFRYNYTVFFKWFEYISVGIFTVEYLLRLWTAKYEEKYANKIGSKALLFFFSTLGLIDLIAILPFYLPLVFTIDLAVLRMLRLFRLLRIFKLGRYSKSMQIVKSVLNDTKSELTVTLFIAFILMVISSTLMYYLEHDAQPDKFASILHSFWWSVATLTTVGYGDVYPVTSLGKFISGLIALIGIGIIALPTGIISSSFITKIQKEDKVSECTCPNCGTTFNN